MAVEHRYRHQVYRAYQEGKMGDDEKIIAIMQEIQNTVNSELPPVAQRMKMCGRK